MKELYDQWLESGDAQVTATGNRKKPSNSEITDMVVEAWNSLSEVILISRISK